MEVISHRYIYHDDDFQTHVFDWEPWVIVSLMFIGAFASIALCSYIIFRIYHVEIVNSLKRHSRGLRNRVRSVGGGDSDDGDETLKKSDVKKEKGGNRADVSHVKKENTMKEEGEKKTKDIKIEETKDGAGAKEAD